MAWNVVIAGGGFGGLYAARTLDRLLAPHSARIRVVNDVKTKGVFVDMGQQKAVAQTLGITWSGLPAWILARSYHLVMMPGLDRRARLLRRLEHRSAVRP